jgi:hypothetical protein
MRARSLVGGAMALGTAVAALAAGAVPAGSSTPDTATLYRQAIASTRAWSVHYASSSTQANKTLLVTGDAGPASGSQTVAMGTGSISIVVIGGTTYLKGNAEGLQNLAGFAAAQAAQAQGQWIEFSTTNGAFAPVVAGVRSHDVAQELALKGPLTAGRAKTVAGSAVDAIEGTQTVARRKVRVVLYVRAKGSHVPVEEISVDANGHPTTLVHVIYSKWGEQVRPRAPHASVSVGPVHSV